MGGWLFVENTAADNTATPLPEYLTQFADFLVQLEDEGEIPSDEGNFSRLEDYSESWAQINWYQWATFDEAKDFVFSTTVEWDSGSDIPNISESGCGLVFRSQDENNHLLISLNMDGYVHLGGFKNGYTLNYPTRYYGANSLSGKHQFSVVAVDGKVMAYVDGEKVLTQNDVAFKRSGDLALTILSGTNANFGTKCSFTESCYYFWN